MYHVCNLDFLFYKALPSHEFDVICTDKHADILPIAGKHVIFTPLDNRWQNADDEKLAVSYHLLPHKYSQRLKSRS